MTRTRSEKRSEIAKEWILLVAGLAGIGYQLVTNNVDIVLLIVFTAMSGVPGLAHLISLFRNSSTVLQSSLFQLPQSDSESDSASLSSTSEDNVNG